jgi:hypothetical protein
MMSHVNCHLVRLVSVARELRGIKVVFAAHLSLSSLPTACAVHNPTVKDSCLSACRLAPLILYIIKIRTLKSMCFREKSQVKQNDATSGRSSNTYGGRQASKKPLPTRCTSVWSVPAIIQKWESTLAMCRFCSKPRSPWIHVLRWERVVVFTDLKKETTTPRWRGVVALLQNTSTPMRMLGTRGYKTFSFACLASFPV